MSEVRFSKLKIENGEWRIDSEYFKKEYLHEDSDLAKHKTVLLGDYAFVTDGQHGYYESDSTSKIHMLAARNCKEYFANTTDAIPLAKWVDDKNKRSSLAHGDIILSTRGSVGCCAIVYDEVLPANINQDVARIKLNNSYNFKPEFLIAYMNCKFGQNWMFRNQTGMVQQGLPLDKVRSIPVPMLSPKFQSQIEEIVKSAHEKLSCSKSLYAEAEDILLSELDLKDWQPKKVSVSVKYFSDFAKSDRLDAEYYQAKYDEIEEIIKSYKGGSDFIGSVFEQNLDTCDYSKSEYKYIEIGDINVGDGSVESNIVPVKELPDNAKRVLHYNDIIISKVRPYRGAVAIINIYDKDLIGSGAFTVLHEKTSYKKEVLQVLLRTKIYKDWLLKWNVGTSYPVIKDEDILNLPVPLLPESTQSLIAEKIQKSFDLRKQSKELLEQAKSMVEEEIEK